MGSPDNSRTTVPWQTSSILVALRISAGSDAVEEGPVGFAGVEEGADAVVGEAAESEGGAFDSFYEVVDGFGGSVGDAGVVPVDDLGVPAGQGAA